MSVWQLAKTWFHKCEFYRFVCCKYQFGCASCNVKRIVTIQICYLTMIARALARVKPKSWTPSFGGLWTLTSTMFSFCDLELQISAYPVNFGTLYFDPDRALSYCSLTGIVTARSWSGTIQSLLQKKLLGTKAYIFGHNITHPDNQNCKIIGVQIR